MPAETKPQKVPGVPYLFKNRKTGEYIGIKNIRDSRKQRSLGTTNFATAKRLLRSFIDEHETRTGEITLAKFCEVFLQTKANKRASTVKGFKWVIKHLSESFPLYNSPIHKIKPSDIAALVGLLNFKAPGTHNRFILALSQIFKAALADGYLAKNTIKDVPDRWKKNPRKLPFAPTVEQFDAILNHLKTTGSERVKNDYVDCIEFLGKAGVGEAEAKNLEWGDINWQKREIKIVRVKTGKTFIVPFYPWLETFLLELWNRKGQPTSGRVFNPIKKCHAILEAACRQLGFPNFHPRSLRSFCIVRLLRANISIKRIAQWQGHSDGGILIMQVYSEVISENEAEQVQRELSRLSVAV